MMMIPLLGTTLDAAAQPPQPPIPEVYFVTGKVLCDLLNDSTIPADGANVTITNQRTLEKLYDTVGPTGDSGESGYYLVDLADFPLGYQDGDQIHIFVVWKETNQIYYGEAEAQVDTSLASQVIDDIILNADDAPPTITNVLADPDPVSYGTAINLSAVITDAIGVEVVHLEIIFPDDSVDNVTITDNLADSDTYYYEYTFPLLGTYSFSFYAVDTSGNSITSAVHSFSVMDDTPPVITGILATPELVVLGNPVNISAVITDAIGVEVVHLEIIFPDDSVDNVTITDNLADSDTYYYEYTFPLLGTYSFSFYAVDTSGNSITSAVHSFSVVETIEDTTPPVLTITSGPSGTTTNTMATFSWSATDDVSDSGDIRYSYKLTGDWSAWTTSTTATYGPLSIGSYTFQVRARDEAGNIATQSRTFTVEEPTVPNQPPTANFSYAQDQNVLTFDASSSFDPDGEIVNYTWAFGDGTTGYGKTITHTYTDSGSFEVILTVKDDDGATDAFKRTITVANQKPNAYFTYTPTKPKIGEEITFTDASDDPDGEVVNWTWDFGDGTISTDQNPHHTYATEGRYNVTLTVTDDKGSSDTTTLSLTVEKEKEPSYILPLLAIIILIVVAIIVVLIWRRQRTT
ncbi:MAG: PKD domain-containing protein [Candidatus Thermoplasmatota archaeon]|nr:PKD domain-containing protein [Candidatus Thermoplasmatota archaeon]